jgi:hypothetical protein
VRHPSLIAWEKKLQRVLSGIDDSVESRYGNLYPLHPSRPEHGTTSSNRQDGLFSVEAKFTTGYGSRHGRGYVIDVQIVTLENVPRDVLSGIEDEIAERLESELPAAFPGAELQVDRDGGKYKIHGDLSLGDVH